MYKKILKIAERELSQLKYIPGTNIVFIAAFCGDVFRKANVPRVNPIPNEYFDAVKEAICNEFYGGCEPEFETESAWNTWNQLNNEYLYYDVEEFQYSDFYKRKMMIGERSPYKDKTIPYLKVNYKKIYK